MVSEYDMWKSGFFERVREGLKISESELMEAVHKIREDGPRTCRAKCPMRTETIRTVEKATEEDRGGYVLKESKRTTNYCPTPICRPRKGRPVWQFDTALVQIAKENGILWDDLFHDYLTILQGEYKSRE